MRWVCWVLLDAWADSSGLTVRKVKDLAEHIHKDPLIDHRDPKTPIQRLFLVDLSLVWVSEQLGSVRMAAA